MMKVLCLFGLAISVASAFDCSAKELAQYDFQSIKGEYSDQITKNTPPSKAVLTWGIGVCQSIEKQSDCPPNSDICGTTRIQVEDKDVLSEVISFNSNLQKQYLPFGDDGKEQESGINITYKGVNWGDLLVDSSGCTTYCYFHYCVGFSKLYLCILKRLKIWVKKFRRDRLVDSLK